MKRQPTGRDYSTSIVIQRTVEIEGGYEAHWRVVKFVAKDDPDVDWSHVTCKEGCDIEFATTYDRAGDPRWEYLAEGAPAHVVADIAHCLMSPKLQRFDHKHS